MGTHFEAKLSRSTRRKVGGEGQNSRFPLPDYATRELNPLNALRRGATLHPDIKVNNSILVSRGSTMESAKTVLMSFLTLSYLNEQSDGRTCCMILETVYASFSRLSPLN